MRVLVTGATGFIGSHTAAALVRAGHRLRLLVRDPERIQAALGPHGITVDDVVVGDVRDADTVGPAVRGCDAVVHAASVFSYDPRDAVRIDEVNVAGTGNVLGAAAAAACDPVVHVSSMVAFLPAGSRR